MKVVVGGANGLIGRHLVRALRARGDEVAALVRDASKGGSWAQGATLLLWDGKSQGPWSSAVGGADAVVNLAGASIAGKRWSEAYKKVIVDSRILATRAVVEAMRAAARKPRAFVNASAVGYYGGRGDEPIDESALAGSDFLARLARDWEDEARKAEALGVRSVLLRTGVVLARDGGALPQMLFPFRAFVGGPIGSGKQYFPWIHIADEVSLILWALDHDLRGPLNAAAPGALTMEQFARTLGRVLRRPALFRVPALALRLLLGEAGEAITEGQHAVPRKALESGYVFRFEDGESALRELLS